ncbi:MAG TPA: redoxin domain-containing protein [Candidatus Eisenbacteria bacterium]|nr:redoxin domain-containing protein [Candidatus Eisenbacteria bacterium]
MKRVWYLMAVLAALIVGARPAAAEKALCLVCSVKEGASHEEEVKAWRTYEGTRYGFCSEKCASEFDADAAAYVPPVLPRPAPELSVADLAGKPVTWKSLEGRVVLVDFWATWCGPCRKSMPELQALHEKYSARGFTVLGVSIDEGNAAAKVKKFVAARKIRYPIAVDSEKTPTWERYRVKAVPAAFLVDQKGQVVAQWTGTSVDAADLEARLGALLKPTD